MGPGLSTALLDTNIVIDVLNGHQAAFETIDAQGDCIVSRVTWIEVLAGCRTPHDETVARQLLSTFSVAELSSDIADLAVTLRRERRFKLPDAVILATARVRGVPLLSRNTRDLPEDDPAIHVPYCL